MGDKKKAVACGQILTLGSNIHNVSLGEGNVRVAINLALDEDALLPIPVGGEMRTVGDAVKSIVAWPRDLVIMLKQRGEGV